MDRNEEKPAKQKSRLKITHAQNDARYVEMGKLLHLQKDPGSDGELDRMNANKNGRPYQYPDVAVMAIAGIRSIYGTLSYRMCQGMAISALGEEDAPDHVTLWRRIRGMKVRQEGGVTAIQNGSDVLCLVPDATGLAPSTRSDWIHHKHRKVRGFIKLSVMINQETREILAFRVTDERKGDSSQFNDLVDDSLKILGLDAAGLRDGVGKAKVKKARRAAGSKKSPSKDHPDAGDVPDGSCAASVENAAGPYGRVPFCPVMHAGGGQIVIELRGDAGYDTRAIFEYCHRLGIVPLIRIKKNANGRANGVGRTRGLAAQDQMCGSNPSPKKLASLDEDERVSNQKEWKERVGYGRRWLVEIVFSSLKRMFGCSVNAVKMENIVQEIAIRIRTYNMLLAVAREAIAMA